MCLCCLFGLVVDKIKVDTLFGVKENKNSALLLSPQVSSWRLFSPPLLIPLVSLLISFHLIYFFSSPFDSFPYISSGFLSFACFVILQLHISSSIVSHLTIVLSSVLSFTHIYLEFWSMLNSTSYEVFHLLFCCLIFFPHCCLFIIF